MEPEILPETAAAPATSPQVLPAAAAPAPSQLVNVVDPDTQEMGSIPVSQLRQAIQQGFTPATPEMVDRHLKEEKYGGLGQQLVTGLEGAASAATFGASTGIERALGVDEKDIQGRRETNPTTHMVGQGAGLLGSAFIPGGAAGVLEKAGVRAAEALGLGGEGASILSQVGSGATKAAVENALFQGGDEVSKMLAGDPTQSVQTAISDIGLSGLIGGGFGAGLGAVSPLWKATVGGKVDQFLKVVSDRANGIDGVLPGALNEAIHKSGLELAPEIRAGLSQDPQIQQMVKTLEQSDTTKSGLAFQESMKEFRTQASESVAGALGKNVEDVKSAVDFSPYESGKKIGSSLADEFKAQVSPLAEKFEKIKEQYADAPLIEDAVIESKGKYNPYGENETTRTVVPGTTSEMAEKIGNLVQQEGWYSSPSSDIMSEVNRVLKELPQQKTLKDLTNYITQVGNNTYDFTNPQLTKAGSMIKEILREGEASVVMKSLQEKAPTLIAEHMEARKAWAQVAKLKDSLDDRLHVGGGNSPTSFIKNLSAMANSDGEKVLRRLSGTNDASLLALLKEQFPQTAELVRQYHIDSLVKQGVSRAGPEQLLNSKAILKAVDKMSPELKQFAIAPESLDKLKAVNALLEHFEALPHNFSNTARTADKLFSYLPGSAVAMASMLTGHNPATALLLAPLTKWLGKDIPDAVRLGILKFLGSNQPIESEGFKTMVDYIQHTMKGETMLQKASGALFKTGREVLPESLMPTEKRREKLDKQLKELQTDQQPLLKIGGKANHYLPEHGMSMGQTAAGAVNYINSLRPEPMKKSPLDAETKPSNAQKQAYQEVLTIAEQPLSVMQKMKDGTLTSQDLNHLKTLYPALHQKMQMKVMEQMVNAVKNEVPIPYKTRMSVSLLLGQPMDSTLTQPSILMKQPKPQGPSGQEIPGSRPKHSMNALNKMIGADQTSGQSREANRNKF